MNLVQGTSSFAAVRKSVAAPEDYGFMTDGGDYVPSEWGLAQFAFNLSSHTAPAALVQEHDN